MNKADGGSEFVKVIDDLLAHDGGRDAFLRALLVKLGLKISAVHGTNGVSSDSAPQLAPIHVSSISTDLNKIVFHSLRQLGADDSAEDDDKNSFTVTDVNDTFLVRCLASTFDSMQDLRQSLNGFHISSSSDPTPKYMFFHPTPMIYAHFSLKEYFNNLPSSSNIGRSLGYVEVTTSTQTLLDKNPTVLRTLPFGFVMTATSQLNGRGRAGNTWLSPRGSLAFSYILHLPRHLSFRLVFVQYLVSLAIVEGIRSYSPEWRDVNVSIKWPNDIYGKPRTTDRWEKIGGIIVNSTYFDDKFILVVGCGINTTNPHPTTSLMNIIPESFQEPKHEVLLAKILATFSDMYSEFLKTGFRKFEYKYYKRWLHEDQVVSIEGGMTRGRIKGINFEDGGSGGLIVDEIDADGRSLGKKLVEVIADGNSFDMMKGLLRRKG